MMIRPMTQEQAQDIRNSTHWGYVLNELDYRITLKLEMLRTCAPDKLPILQGEIALLEEIKRLPDDVADRESNSEPGSPLVASLATTQRSNT